MKYLFADLETYSATPIRFGQHRYAEDCEILLFGYAIDDAPAKVWDCTRNPTMPAELREALDEVVNGDAKSVWHNGMNFDTIVIDHVLGIRIPPAKIVDTMVMAYQHGLPGALGDLCDVMRLSKDKAKDKDGARLVQEFCKPQPVGRKLSRRTRETHPDDWARFVNYCRLDVEAERELFRRMPKFNLSRNEKALQVLDAEINRHGMLMDVDLARGAIELYDRQKRQLAKAVVEKTAGAVQSATQRDALIAYLRDSYGWEITSMTKSELEQRVRDESVPEPVRELLKIRLMSTKTSIQKFRAVLDAVSSDNRLRGCLQFRGAARTGRFSGRRFQPQNLARPTMPEEEINWAIETVKDGTFGLWFEDPSAVLPNLLRGLIVATPGQKLVVADFSNIEGRVLAWLAGEEWKLGAFRAYDEGHGHDLYKLAYSRGFGVKPEDVTKQQRQIGKVMELALGYGGGASAFLTFAKGYGINLEDMANAVRHAVDPTLWSYAETFYAKGSTAQQRQKMSRDVFCACDSVKRAWRKANNDIVSLWDDVARGVKRAVRHGETYRIHDLTFSMMKNFLTIRLPSGRHLAYPSPRMEENNGPSGEGFSYMGVEQFSRKWTRIRSYGPKCVENIVQAISCDLLCEAMLRLDAAGYKTILTVHDEIIAEAPDTSEFSYDRMAALMTEVPAWARGLPLAAAGYEDYRYKKD